MSRRSIYLRPSRPVLSLWAWEGLPKPDGPTGHRSPTVGAPARPARLITTLSASPSAPRIHRGLAPPTRKDRNDTHHPLTLERRVLDRPALLGVPRVERVRGQPAREKPLSTVQPGPLRVMGRSRGAATVPWRATAAMDPATKRLGETNGRAPRPPFRHCSRPNFLHSRDGRIRTGDPLNPIQVRYRAAPRPAGEER